MHKRAMGLCLVVSFLASGCYDSAQKTGTASSRSTTTTSGAITSGDPTASSGAGGKVHKLAGGLQYEDVVVGSGKMAEPGMHVSVHYAGTLTDGTPFDSSLNRGTPYKFQLGAGEVIQGWDEGIKGMRIGGKRKLTIPPDMAYGSRGMGGVIPPNATLLFDVELVDVQ